MAKPHWTYGKHTAPKTWHEAADILRKGDKPVQKSSGLAEALKSIEKLLKDKK